eukprot:scaffold10649_cov214-Ochromonas_danica.AAC.3
MDHSISLTRTDPLSGHPHNPRPSLRVFGGVFPIEKSVKRWYLSLAEIYEMENVWCPSMHCSSALVL